LDSTKNVKEEWNAIIAQKLKDGVSVEDLKHEYAEGLWMEPNVVASDIQSYSHNVEISKPWINMASISGGDSSEKNRLALLALQQGANGLSIGMSPSDSIDEILKDVLTEYLDVRIDCIKLSKEEINSQKSKINDAEFPNVRWVGDHSSTKQIFVAAENRMDSLKSCLNNIDSDTTYDIVVSLSKNLLFEIASLRAIRSLLDDNGIKTFNILAQFQVEGSNELGDYNLIEKTYKILSGVLGGADAVLTPYTGDEESRLTLNVHNVLDLESGMKNVLDPLSGSYYIEKLTGEIIRQVKG